LAGSENTAKHDNNHERFNEGNKINLSLMFLKNVIERLSRKETFILFF
jgi:hypothetical protein